MGDRREHSPMARTILIGQWVIRAVAGGAPCPCEGPPGEHQPGCLIAEAFRVDPWARQQAEEAIDRHG